ncbi:DUF4097 family beta strand repeat-containing protein [Cyclobacterium sp.]|uniref:DUF4097 family beta strand repeat-containing protein n=1 Tax=Cyclobacterium sp. TaxID=1966343 RepID=UPI0019BCA845|nr:DUF4097 family beta strand repeat-containing protein [Cyclobacterium sp.]MBD3627152.1 DUF4097 family beta strand repeat protein [Cyclobacterium sp.]
MNKNRIALLLLAISSCLIGCNPLPMETISDLETSYEGIKKVTVKGGELEISYTGGEDTDKVYLNAYITSTDPDLEGVVFNRSGDELIVEFDPDIDFSFFFGNRVKGFISLTGPSEMALEMNSSSGKMEVNNVRHDFIELRGSSGKIEASNLESPNLHVKISSGRADLENIRGDLNLELSSGMGSLEGMEGNVRFKGSSGLVKISDVNGLVTGEMSSGKADLESVESLGEISISSGMLSAINCGLGKDTQLSASSGYMKIETISDLNKYNFDFKVGSGRLSIGDRSSSEDLIIDHGAETTIKGKLQSGRLDIQGS